MQGIEEHLSHLSSEWTHHSLLAHHHGFGSHETSLFLWTMNSFANYSSHFSTRLKILFILFHIVLLPISCFSSSVAICWIVPTDREQCTRKGKHPPPLNPMEKINLVKITISIKVFQIFQGNFMPCVNSMDNSFFEGNNL